MAALDAGGEPEGAAPDQDAVDADLAEPIHPARRRLIASRGRYRHTGASSKIRLFESGRVGRQTSGECRCRYPHLEAHRSASPSV